MRTLLVIFTCALVLASAAPVFALQNPFQKANTLLGETGTQAYGGKPEGDLAKTVGGFINAALALLGVIFLVLMIYAGFRWMTAQGDPEIVKKSKDIITAAVIGLVVVFAAYAVTFFVVSRLSNAAQGGGSLGGSDYTDCVIQCQDQNPTDQAAQSSCIEQC